jgi:Rps23 Pro-64 3,4-dihydroxylase Tpa1-like proline 4-hydroxylase
MAMTASSELFRILETLTRCEPIGCYAFRVYRMDPGDRHHDTWHGDDNGNRLLTLSINVGLEPFEGGELELRARGSEHMIESAANTGPGDALLFRIAPGLEHRVCGVTGHTSKFAVAGWFQREPKMDLAAVLGR